MVVAIIFELSSKLGKKSEYAERKCFSEKKAKNHLKDRENENR